MGDTARVYRCVVAKSVDIRQRILTTEITEFTEF